MKDAVNAISFHLELSNVKITRSLFAHNTASSPHPSPSSHPLPACLAFTSPPVACGPFLGRKTAALGNFCPGTLGGALLPWPAPAVDGVSDCTPLDRSDSYERKRCHRVFEHRGDR